MGDGGWFSNDIGGWLSVQTPVETSLDAAG